MNSSTLQPFRLDLAAQMRICAGAGFEGIELWMRDIQSFVDAGGSLADIRALADDLQIEICNSISFIKWEDADPSVRDREIEKAKREMEMLTAVGCTTMAAPPVGETLGVTIDEGAQHFARLWTVGTQFGVEPFLEHWGHRGNIRTIDDARTLLEKSGISGARLLVDPYHIHKGGGDLRDLSKLSRGSIGIVHVNDFPLSRDRAVLTDRDRRFPGEGDADLGLFCDCVLRTGYRSYFSLELFIEDFGGKTAEEVAARGFESLAILRARR
jgi:2-keto-myo-inositol isomerase